MIMIMMIISIVVIVLITAFSLSWDSFGSRTDVKSHLFYPCILNTVERGSSVGWAIRACVGPPPVYCALFCKLI